MANLLPYDVFIYSLYSTTLYFRSHETEILNWRQWKIEWKIVRNDFLNGTMFCMTLAFGFSPNPIRLFLFFVFVDPSSFTTSFFPTTQFSAKNKELAHTRICSTIFSVHIGQSIWKLCLVLRAYLHLLAICVDANPVCVRDKFDEMIIRTYSTSETWDQMRTFPNKKWI